MFYSNVSQPMSHWQWPNDTAQYSVKVHYRHPRYPPYNRSRIQNLWCLTRVRLARSTIPEIMRWLFKKFWKLFSKQEFFILEVTYFEKSKLSSASDGISASIFFSFSSLKFISSLFSKFKWIYNAARDLEILELSLGFWVVGSGSRRGFDAKVSRWVSALPLHTTTEILILNMSYT